MSCLAKFSFLTLYNFYLERYSCILSNYACVLYGFYPLRLSSVLIHPYCHQNSTNEYQHYVHSTTNIACLRQYSSDKNHKKMVHILNVAEKNDAAKSLADILSRGGYRRREGLSIYNKIYEFDTILDGQRCKMTMTSVSGHLLTHSFTGNYKKWHGCNPLDLFDAPLVKICQPNMEGIQKTLEREARSSQRLIIWTDCDREGENIGFEIISVCTEVNPNLQVNRAKFSEITHQSVTRALANLGPPDERQNNAVEVRSELDLRIGASFTRFQTLRLQKVFPEALTQTLISYGSCQFPTLGFVVERYKAIENFIPEQFWKIKVCHEVENFVVEFHWSRVRLFNQLACQVLHERCLDNPKAIVKSVKSRMKSKWRPLPLDTIELEKLCSRKLRLKAKETMRIAEKLYTGGLISYPRTETNIFPKEMDLRPLVEMQTPNPNWGEFASRILEDGPNPRQGRKSDQAHPPIHPTKHTTNLEGDEQRVYEFVVRHFLACCHKDAKGTETVVHIDVADEEFLASGLIILERNYLDVYPYEKWSEKEMPHYDQGQEFDPTSIEMVGGQTSPPSLLTEADLIALMEKHGIGTDATHADHIETIKNRLYVGLRDSRFVPGELGMGLVEGYDDMGFQMSKPHLRSELEADLKRICEGKKDPEVVLREQIDKYRNVFKEAIKQAAKIDVALSRFLNEAPQLIAPDDAFPHLPTEYLEVMKCPKCGSSVVLRSKRDNKGFFLSCQGYPDCKAAIWFPQSVVNVQVLDQRCEWCTDNLRKLKFTFTPRAYTPILPNEYEGCIGGCDTLFMETLNIHPLTRARGVQRRDTPSNTQSRFRDSGYSSNNSSSTFTPSGNIQNRPPLVNRINTQTRTTGSSFSDRSTPKQPPSSTLLGGWGNRSSGGASLSQSGFDWGADSSEVNAIVCNCNEDAILLTVRKEGPNTGRQFYKCNKPLGQGCNFFLWADDGESNPGSGNQTGASSNTRSSRGGRNSSGNSFSSTTNVLDWGEENAAESQPVTCRCGIPSKCLTTMKEGPNKGREFYVCPKTREEQCGYFQWVDEVTPDGGGGGTQRGAPTVRHRGLGSSRGGVKRSSSDKKRKCGICGEEGHDRRNCPRS